LSTILSVEFVDLPVSQIMAKMEDEFGTNDGQITKLLLVMLTVEHIVLASLSHIYDIYA